MGKDEPLKIHATLEDVLRMAMKADNVIPRMKSAKKPHTKAARPTK